MWGDIAIAFLLACLTAFVATPYTIKLAKKVGAIDMPEDRRVNKKPMPRIGRNCCNFRIFSISFLSYNYYVYRRKNRLK